MRDNRLNLYSLFFQSGIPGVPYFPGSSSSASCVDSVDGDALYPVDFLEGRMDLRVVLPSHTVVKMAVERRYVGLVDQLIRIYLYFGVILAFRSFFSNVANSLIVLWG